MRLRQRRSSSRLKRTGFPQEVHRPTDARGGKPRAFLNGQGGRVFSAPCYRYLQRTGERPEQYYFKGFACTRAREQVPALTTAFPDGWHIEEFYRFDQSLGWKRAGTLNLHIRLGQMTLALLAQAVIQQLRQRLGAPFHQWDSVHLAQGLFSRLEGDMRVDRDTLLVTYYNAPRANEWKAHFENLPQRLQKEGVDPRVPWLYNFKLDFRFKQLRGRIVSNQLPLQEIC